MTQGSERNKKDTGLMVIHVSQGQSLLSAFRASSGSNGTAGSSGWSVPPFAVDLIRFPWTKPSRAGFTMGLPEFCACGASQAKCQWDFEEQWTHTYVSVPLTYTSLP